MSRLHEHQSYELADFPVPSGREEEWRFIPLRRLRRLQGDTVLPECKVTVETDPAPEVAASRAERGDRRLGTAYVPADRVSARAYASFAEATVITVPAEAVASRPTVISVRGEDAAGAAFGHTLIELEPHTSAVVMLDHQGSVPLGRASSPSAGDAESVLYGGPGPRIEGAVDGGPGDIGEAQVAAAGVGPQPGESLGQIDVGAF